MTTEEKLWWAMCLRAHRYRYSYGRQANRTLKDLELPDEMPAWAEGLPLPDLDASQLPLGPNPTPAMTGWDGSLTTVAELFDISYGQSLELNALKEDAHGVNFVSRTAENNGVSAKVERLVRIEPGKSGDISVALGGSVLETFLQPESFYCGRDVAILTPKRTMTIGEKLWWIMCLRAHQYRYSYGRQANRTLKDLELPNFVPTWAVEYHVPDISWENASKLLG